MPAVHAAARAAVPSARIPHNQRRSFAPAPEMISAPSWQVRKAAREAATAAALLADPFAGVTCPRCVGSGVASLVRGVVPCPRCAGEGRVYPRGKRSR